MTQLPRPITLAPHLSVQRVGEETLIYDERTHTAFCLDRVASACWDCCDGAHTPAEIAACASLALEHPVSEDAVLFALARFAQDGLLVEDAASDSSASLIALSTLSRRTMLRRLGTGAALALPVVAAVMAPRAAQAYNGCVNCSVTSSPASPADASPAPGAAPKPADNPKLFNDNIK